MHIYRDNDPLNLSLRLHQEVATKGVRVQVVLPGATRTAIREKAGTDIATVPQGVSAKCRTWDE